MAVTRLPNASANVYRCEIEHRRPDAYGNLYAEYHCISVHQIFDNNYYIYTLSFVLYSLVTT